MLRVRGQIRSHIGYEKSIYMWWDKSKGNEKIWSGKNVREVKIEENKAWEGCERRWWEVRIEYEQSMGRA